MSIEVRVRRADLSDIPKLAGTMAAAFQHDPVSGWLIPDEADRGRRHPAFFRIFLDHAMTWGEVHTTDEFEGVALWLDVDPDLGVASGGEATELFRAALGPSYERFMLLDGQMRGAHPTHERHVFLPFIAVLPEEQGHGIGRALMLRKLVELDEIHMPVYLEASSLRSRRFYERLGFKQMAARIRLPQGPALFPMWRHPSGNRELADSRADHDQLAETPPSNPTRMSGDSHGAVQ